MIASACQLANDVFVCLADDRLVFSDIRRDRYRCLSRSNTISLLRLFPEFPKFDDAGFPERSTADHDQTKLILHALTRAGLFVGGENSGKTFTPVRLPAPTESIESRGTTSSPRSGHLASFTWAASKASAKLRLLSLGRIVRGVERRKERHIEASFQDRRTLCELVAIFHRLRPYYIREYLCRFDSLALIEFLAHYHQFPDWVFGVTSEPFAAHCWVQEEEFILNDSVDYVSRYTPIMTF